MAWSTPATATTGQIVTAAFWNQEIRDNLLALFPEEITPASWTPTLEASTTDPTTSATVGRQYQIGGLMHLWVRWTFSAAGSGNYFVTLPVASSGITASAAGIGLGTTIGQWTIRDSSVPNSRDGSVLLRDSDQAWFNAEQGMASNLFPFPIVSGDVLSCHIVYPTV